MSTKAPTSAEQPVTTPREAAPKPVAAGTRIGHVHLKTADIQRVHDFYVGILGFDVIFRMPEALFLSAGGYHHHLGTNIWAAGAPQAREGDARLLEWTVRLPEGHHVDAAAKSLSSGGYEVSREGGDAVSIDPWGTRVRITAGR